MRLRAVTFALLLLLAFTACGGGSPAPIATPSPIPTPTPTPSTHNQWAWVAGPNLADQPGNYGTLGVAASTNLPPPRDSAMTWTDASGSFWVFGGAPAPGTSTNDLWKYSAGQWTWMAGSSSTNQRGVYGTLGVSAPGNTPGSRLEGVTWADASGNLWLFGGLGLDAFGVSNFLNDLWKYNSGQWTWMGGSNTGTQTQPGIYGVLGTPSPSNIPGARSLASSWTDPSGNFWLFGGWGLDSQGKIGYLNDLWKYSGGQWTWMSGSDVANQSGVYGTQGIASPTNVPGARQEALAFVDASGALWLFGGSPGPQGSFGLFNDLWKYSNGQWTWMSGSNLVNQIGNYGTKGVASSTTVPGGRVLSAVWTDASGNLWIFGGNGYDASGRVDYLNDLWKYSGGQWTWMSGSNSGMQPGSYGTMGTSSSSNISGGRYFGMGWKDANGNLWLFGGSGYDATGKLGRLNDTWRYQP